MTNIISSNDSRIDVLRNLAPLVNAVVDADQLMYILIKFATKFTGAKLSSLLLINEETKKLDFYIASGSKTQKLKHAELEMGEGIAGLAAKDGKAILVNNVKEDKRWSKRVGETVGYNAGSIACAPLLINKKVIGVIEIIDKFDGTLLTDADLVMLVAFSEMAATLLDKSKRYESINTENYLLKKKLKEDSVLMGSTQKMDEIFATALKVAKTSTTVLISGESGTGKEVLAKFVHAESDRSKKEMISINCAAVPETMLERELFGHEKGAFTNADSLQIGLFEAADHGTLFLDEISEMSTTMQVKLLRVLQERTFYRLGGTKLIKIDVRIITATNRKLDEMVKSGKFREDLFYRLNVININMPPLKERKDDIPALVNCFIREYFKEEGKSIPVVMPDAMDILLNYVWPGNVRQLKNAIERALVIVDGNKITVHDLPPEILNSSPVDINFSPTTLKEGLNLFKMRLINKTLEETNGNRTKAAKILAIERTYLSKLIKELSVE